MENDVSSNISLDEEAEDFTADPNESSAERCCNFSSTNNPVPISGIAGTLIFSEIPGGRESATESEEIPIDDLRKSKVHSASKPIISLRVWP